ncbi:hypothetical protein I545_3446 [Mycobacterium kansasii 662]|uniref:Uncharacterized protein n=2 Tax=Mycobacterium kansasii TaxID=1768 RepID=A0A1V3X647_MYCKA|nr:hypothetical protein I547_6070 [Mycobacterium kansasii 824]EUA18015.1 hypothetical protein I545_3446 [Mycobacterium kansasii 662]OOK74713.1 hypothetical protein BZL29_4347 [Mycobacterium kansasii]
MSSAQLSAKEPMPSVGSAAGSAIAGAAAPTAAPRTMAALTSTFVNIGFLLNRLLRIVRSAGPGWPVLDGRSQLCQHNALWGG